MAGFLAVASRHGVVEPAVRRVAVQPHMIALLGFLQTVAEAHDIVHGYDMIRLAEDSQDRARYSRDELLDRRRPKLIAVPFLAADGAVEHHRSRDVISLGREQHRLPSGLAHADDADARAVDLVRFFQVIHRRVQIFQRFVVAQIDSRLPLAEPCGRR